MLSSTSFRCRSPVLYSHPLPAKKGPFFLVTLQTNHNPQFHGLSFLRSPPLDSISPASFFVQSKPPTADKSSEQKWVHEGLITESLPNGMFRVRLDNEDLILGYVSGKIRKNFVRILPGDRVKVEVSRYDSTKGRIIYRLRSSRD
ncbi:translation initiation factor IF-1, chloroplastic [Quillaja saponaria]|uniref:Translation initiation factor IF-1, chloroplastic n=1 Tax=Quillaja saponaria TaxID=32244 RepID=A0AAD7KZ82_QUISA|nr:translation initiation factor IF-1, chloroplastic [Quillaja saponaria]